MSDFGGIEAVDEVLVVDNNSGDHIAAQAEAAGAHVVREARQGYGNALHRGLAEAQGEYAVLAEPDGTFMGKDVLKRLAYADGFDLVVGTGTTRDLILARRPNMGCQLRRGNSVDATVKIKPQMVVRAELGVAPAVGMDGCVFKMQQLERDVLTSLLLTMHLEPIRLGPTRPILVGTALNNHA